MEENIDIREAMRKKFEVAKKTHKKNKIIDNKINQIKKGIVSIDELDALDEEIAEIDNEY